MELPQTVQTYMSAGLQDALVKFHEKKSSFSRMERRLRQVRDIRKNPAKGASKDARKVSSFNISHPAQGGAAIETVIYGHGGCLSPNCPHTCQQARRVQIWRSHHLRKAILANACLGLGGDEDLIGLDRKAANSR